MPTLIHEAWKRSWVLLIPHGSSQNIDLSSSLKTQLWNSTCWSYPTLWGLSSLFFKCYSFWFTFWVPLKSVSKLCCVLSVRDCFEFFFSTLGDSPKLENDFSFLNWSFFYLVNMMFFLSAEASMALPTIFLSFHLAYITLLSCRCFRSSQAQMRSGSGGPSSSWDES